MSDQPPTFPTPAGGDRPPGDTPSWPTPGDTPSWPTPGDTSSMPSAPSMPSMPSAPSMPGSLPAPGAPPTIEWSAPGMPLPSTGYGQPTGPQAIPLADSGLRFAARLLDRIIMGFIGCLPTIGITGSAAAFGARGSGGALSGLSGQVAASMVSAIIVLLYDGVATGLLGGTLMKKAFGMRVVNQSDGQPVTMQTALLRAAPLAVCTAIPVLGGIAALVMGIVSLIFLFSDKLRQTVSDKVAKTVVIKAN